VSINSAEIFERVRKESPVVHHITNWVTIYQCAAVVKSFGASPVMAHAKEEVEQMSGIAGALVLNIGTLTPELIESMKLAARAANRKGIPVVLDVCGAGATALRDGKSLELLNEAKIDIIKGNASEVARVAGKQVRTKGVDALAVEHDLEEVAWTLAGQQKCAVVITGKEDIISDGKNTFIVSNGDPMMSKVVGTGCMAASVIGTFAAVEKDLARAAAAGLSCYEIAAELAARESKGPGSFLVNLFDEIYGLNTNIVEKMQKTRMAR
jgi:hydroxyethylthiazole kinase